MKSIGRAPDLPSQVAKMISDEILSGRFGVGDRLPTERELAESFGVSRNVIREAVARLRSEGTVEPRQGAGVFVTAGASRSAISIDREILRDKSLFRSLFELRAIIEIEAAGLAAERRTAKQLAAIEAALDRVQKAQETPDSADADLAYHAAIARASDNVYVATFVNFISEHVRTSIVRTDAIIDASIRAHHNREEHGAVFEAIAAQDGKRARLTMKRHIANAMVRLGVSVDAQAKPSRSNGGSRTLSWSPPTGRTEELRSRKR